MSRQEFCEYVTKMKRYASVHGHEGILNKLVEIYDIITGLHSVQVWGTDKL
jgi:hypothetical protein